VSPDGLVEALGRGHVGDADPEVVDDAAGAHGPVVDRLGAAAVGVEQERAVVVRHVLGPRTGRAVVAVPGGRAHPPELVDRGTRAHAEADVQPAGRALPGAGATPIAASTVA
jgi:hypothetical protein